ncbi:hypothetical protein HDU81_007695 [Chytriomyces hyalinus]|nr:hypothetical protein HDU81_007695 [Chytriomyces hyalinus]
MPDTKEHLSLERWESAWQEGRTGWDLGGATPALLAVLESHESALFPPSKSQWSVLIPGCGRGYDLAAFAARRGVSAVGLDISPTGVAEADKELHQVRGLPRDIVQVQLADFFEFSPAAPFDIIFDHTLAVLFPTRFLCALVPSLRSAWSNKMSQHVNKGGHLVCLMFPLRDADEKGPPYALSVEIYNELLSPNFKQVFIRGAEDSEKPRVGINRDDYGAQKISVWERL